MNFRKLLTYLTVGTAAVIPFAGAQNPTILQGSYISNVFGNSNFVLNPNAQTNIANVTTVTATVTRSTTTPLVATSEFTVAIGTANGTATWATRAFDAGMKGQNCEARFSYRGFAATSKVHIKQGANAVASLTLTPATDPRIASINFPCGDLSTATTFVVTDTAILAGTNEIGGIYVGLATNMANVAQAELVGTWTMTGKAGCDFATSATAFGSPTNYNTADTDCNDPAVTGVVVSRGKVPSFDFTAKPGNYVVTVQGLFRRTTANSGVYFRLTDGTTSSGYQIIYTSSTSELYGLNTISWNLSYNTAGTKTIYIDGQVDSASAAASVLNNNPSSTLVFTVYRFPSSSELVVTPERQNTFGGVRIFSNGLTNSVTAVSPTKLTTAGTATRTLYGKADSIATNDLSITIKNLPVGSFKVEATGTFYTRSTVSGQAVACQFSLSDSPTAGSPITTMYQDAYGDATATTQDMMISSMSGVYVNTSVADRTFYVRALRGSGANGSCVNYSDDGAPTTIIVTPLDQPSNSALYVQGPVLGANTGAAIPAGYVFEQTSSNPGFTITNNVVGIQNITSFTLNAGVWMVEANCIFRSNAGTATTVWNFAAAMIADANNSTAGTDDMSYSYSFLGHINVASQYYPIFIKRYINVTSATTYYLNTQNSYGANNPTVACNLKRTRLN